jgi:hypothetical protein
MKNNCGDDYKEPEEAYWTEEEWKAWDEQVERCNKLIKEISTREDQEVLLDVFRKFPVY